MRLVVRSVWLNTLAIMAIMGLVHSSSSASKRTEDAEMYFVEGQMSQQEGQLKEALPFYRAALRLIPDSVEYLSLIGNIEYLLGHYEVAQKRFKKILQLNSASSSQIATAKYYVTLTNKKLRVTDTCLAGNCPEDDQEMDDYIAIPELPDSILLDCDSKDDCDGFPSFAEHSTGPFIIRGALRSLNADLSVFTPESLNQTYSTHNVDFYPQNMLNKPNKVYTVPFHKALGYLAYPEGAYLSVDASEQGTYIQWNMNETVWDDVLTKSNLAHSLPRKLSHSLDDIFPKQIVSMDVGETGETSAWQEQLNRIKHGFGRKTHWYMLLIGEEGSGMFPHQDTLAVGSWQVQVIGSKRWRLCTPSSSAMRSTLEIEESDEFDVQENNQDTFPSNDICYESVVKSGDLVYYPPFYWHQTLNLESPSVALSGTVVTPSSRQTLIKMLQAECSSDSTGFSFDGEFCALLAQQ